MSGSDINRYFHRLAWADCRNIPFHSAVRLHVDLVAVQIAVSGTIPRAVSGLVSAALLRAPHSKSILMAEMKQRVLVVDELRRHV
ncbi:hypothetical protein D9M71_797070 [compost metagenome]